MLALKSLIGDHWQVTDLSPLQGLSLETIRLNPQNLAQGAPILRDMRSLKTVGFGHEETWPAAEFWARYEKGEFTP